MDGLSVSRPELIVQESDGAFREMLHNLLAFSSRLEGVRGRFAGSVGLTGPQYTILITVRQLQAHGHVGVSQVADHLALTPTFVTMETKKLVALGLLEKSADPDDLRRVRLAVTREGEARLSRLAPFQRQVNDRLFAPLTIETFALLRGLSAELRQSAEAALGLADGVPANEARPA